MTRGKSGAPGFFTMGAPLLLTALLVLMFVTFSLLSLSSAREELRRGGLLASRNQAYYTACNQADNLRGFDPKCGHAFRRFQHAQTAAGARPHKNYFMPAHKGLRGGADSLRKRFGCLFYGAGGVEIFRIYFAGNL